MENLDFYGSSFHSFFNLNNIKNDSPSKKILNIENPKNIIKNYKLILHFAEYCHNIFIKQNNFLTDNFSKLLNKINKSKLIYSSSYGVIYPSKLNTNQFNYDIYKIKIEKIISNSCNNYLILRFPYIFSINKIKINSIFHKALILNIKKHEKIPILFIEKYINKIWNKINYLNNLSYNFEEEIIWIYLDELREWILEQNKNFIIT